jgi:di/tricarboxylate transporter
VRKPDEQVQVAAQPESKSSRRRRLALSSLAALLCVGVLLRLGGFPVPAWALLVAGAAQALVLILPALGGRMHEPEDSAFKKVPWGT